MLRICCLDNHNMAISPQMSTIVFKILYYINTHIIPKYCVLSHQRLKITEQGTKLIEHPSYTEYTKCIIGYIASNLYTKYCTSRILMCTKNNKYTPQQNSLLARVWLNLISHLVSSLVVTFVLCISASL